MAEARAYAAPFRHIPVTERGDVRAQAATEEPENDDDNGYAPEEEAQVPTQPRASALGLQVTFVS